jgi:peptidoglycan/xylan/chitin deacetylase (PgdA/CDA1 family)
MRLPGDGTARTLVGSSLFTGAALAGMTWAVRGRSSTVFGPSVWRGRPGRKRIALTFDDGPSPATPRILDILAAYGVSATFFQCGINVLRAPELSRAASQSGHEIGNHSHSHPNLALQSRSFVAEEFLRAQDAIAKAASQIPVLMRAPFGVRWFGLREAQRRLGLLGVMWSVIGRDWKLPAPAVAQRVLARVDDGAIICLHDGRGILKDPEVGPTVEAVRRIIPSLLARGYHFKTVSELLCPQI